MSCDETHSSENEGDANKRRVEMNVNYFSLIWHSLRQPLLKNVECDSAIKVAPALRPVCVICRSCLHLPRGGGGLQAAFTSVGGALRRFVSSAGRSRREKKKTRKKTTLDAVFEPKKAISVVFAE